VFSAASDAVGRAAVAARELMADMDHAGGEIEVVPLEREHLGEAHPGVGTGREQRSVSPRA